MLLVPAGHYVLVMREEQRSGLAYVEAVTTLLQRTRNAHPTKGLYEAAELQFWWMRPRSTDDFPQLFWFDDDDLPVAAVITNDFGGAASSLLYTEPTSVFAFMPDATPEFIDRVVVRTLEHLGEHGINNIELECDQADDVMRRVMFSHGFEVKEAAVMEEGWLRVEDRVPVSELHEGYQLRDRSEMLDRPHHQTRPGGPDPEERLHQVSLYRADLDLVVVDENEEVAALGMFWFDPATGVGVVEPMRTMDDHQQRGLARHVLTSGIERLAQAGASRISIGWGPENPASGHLYRSVGFVPHRMNDLLGN